MITCVGSDHLYFRALIPFILVVNAFHCLGRKIWHDLKKKNTQKSFLEAEIWAFLENEVAPKGFLLIYRHRPCEFWKIYVFCLEKSSYIYYKNFFFYFFILVMMQKFWFSGIKKVPKIFCRANGHSFGCVNYQNSIFLARKHDQQTVLAKVKLV